MSVRTRWSATAYLHARDCLGEPVSQRQLSATFGVPRPKVATLLGTLNGTRPNDAEEDVTDRVLLTQPAPTAGHAAYCWWLGRRGARLRNTELRSPLIAPSRFCLAASGRHYCNGGGRSLPRPS